MSAQIEFSATLPDGRVVTRTSGTMPYVATVGGVTWHKTFAAAYKSAASPRGAYGPVIPVIPTKIKGKLGDWTPHIDGWGDIPASAFTELVAAKS